MQILRSIWDCTILLDSHSSLLFTLSCSVLLTVKYLSIRTGKFEQTVWTKIPKKQSDRGPQFSFNLSQQASYIEMTSY